MKTLKGWIPTGVLMAIVLFGSTVAKADGIIVNFGDDQRQPCTVDTKGENVDNGIIVNLTGIIVNFTGIIVNLIDTGDSKEVANTPVENCGIIVN